MAAVDGCLRTPWESRRKKDFTDGTEQQRRRQMQAANAEENVEHRALPSDAKITTKLIIR